MTEPTPGYAPDQSDHARWGGVIQAAAAALAALPGLGTLISGLAVPSDLRVLFGGLYTIVGTTVIMLVWAARGWLIRKSVRAIAAAVTLSVILAILSFGTYQWLFRQTVLSIVDSRDDIERTHEFRFPLFGAAALDSLIDRYGSRAEAVARYTPERMGERLQEPDIGLALAVTDLLLLLSFLMLAVPLAFGIGLAGIAAQSSGGFDNGDVTTNHSRPRGTTGG